MISMEIDDYCDISIGLACVVVKCQLCGVENTATNDGVVPYVMVDVSSEDTFIGRTHYCMKCYEYLYKQAYKGIRNLPTMNYLLSGKPCKKKICLPAVEIKGTNPFLLYHPKGMRGDDSRVNRKKDK